VCAVGSWFISPLLAGAVSTVIFYICRVFVLNKAEPLEPGLRLLPVFYALTIVINIFSVFYDGPASKRRTVECYSNILDSEWYTFCDGY
jgi:phosphate/sulfate permease